MTRPGLKAALKYGEKLPKFKSMAEAEKYFFARKDKLLGKFEKKCEQYSFFTPDYSVESLKKLDPVAYVRFASVYREFKDVNTFMDELKKILE